MFESDNKISSLNQSNLEPQTYEVVNSTQDDSMYYMPDKFLKPEKTKQGGGLFLKILIVLLLIGVLSVGAFAFYILKLKDDNTTITNNEEVLNLEKKPQEQEEEKEVDNLDTPEGRDKKRIEDIQTLVSSISLYFSRNKNYPGSLNAQALNLKQLPVDPSGGVYTYILDSSGRDYKLIFTLEYGANFGDQALLSGEYQINSRGIIDEYKEDEENQEDENYKNNKDNTENDNSGIFKIPPSGPDEDNDGLTNAEELLFGTEIGIADTDSDGYSDSDEIENLYDPLSKTGKLADNVVLAKVLYNESQNYSILYPAKWTFEHRTSDFKQTVFYGDRNDDFFLIEAYDNSQDLSLSNWYLSYSPGAKTEDLLVFSGEKMDGLSTKDGMNVYYSINNKVYVLSYKVLNEKELNYYSTFLMFARSFREMK